MSQKPWEIEIWEAAEGGEARALGRRSPWDASQWVYHSHVALMFWLNCSIFRARHELYIGKY